MGTTNETNVRDELEIHDKDVLSSRKIELKIADATKTMGEIGVTDEQAERYLTCYLIARSWKVHSVKSLGDGVSFEPPSPQEYKDLYVDRLRELGQGSFHKINWEKSDTINPN